MSDQDVAATLDALEQMLQNGIEGPETIGQWQLGFDQAVASAERGPRWAEITERAHRLSHLLDERIAVLAHQREGLRKELDLQTQGARALKGYRPG